jgi:hypothetical protein
MSDLIPKPLIHVRQKIFKRKRYTQIKYGTSLAQITKEINTIKEKLQFPLPVF